MFNKSQMITEINRRLDAIQHRIDKYEATPNLMQAERTKKARHVRALLKQALIDVDNDIPANFINLPIQRRCSDSFGNFINNPNNPRAYNYSRSTLKFFHRDLQFFNGEDGEEYVTVTVFGPYKTRLSCIQSIDHSAKNKRKYCQTVVKASSLSDNKHCFK